LVVRQVEIPQQYKISGSCDTKNTYSIWLMTYKVPVKMDSFGLREVLKFKNPDGAYQTKKPGC